MKGFNYVLHLIFVFFSGLIQRIGHLFHAVRNYRWHNVRVTRPDNELLFIPATELAEKIRTRELRSETIVAAYVDRLRLVNPLLNAVCFDRYKTALEEARAVDAKLDEQGEPPVGGWPPLLGVPVTIKEAFAYAGFQQTGGLKKRIGYIARHDAPAVSRLKEAGAIILATTNVSELCLWWESHNLVYGTTRNPYNLAAIVGGSSGGEGAVVAAGASLFGLGSDIGGSVRMPAFFCGVFGHKPSTGIAESAGQFPECDSPNEWYMISSGPICRYAVDLTLFMSVILKPSLSKEVRISDPVDLTQLKYFSLEEWTTKAHFTDAVDEELVTAQRQVAKTWTSNVGMPVESLRVPEFFYQFPMWAGMMNEKDRSSTTFTQLMAGGGSQKANPFWEGFKWIFNASEHTAPAITLGMTESLLHKQHKQQLRQAARCRLLKDKIADILGPNGVMFAPVHPKAGYFHRQTLLHAGNFTYTAIWNALGFPATSVPLGLGKRGLPLGIQVIANFNNDRYCLAVSRKLEELFGGWACPN